MRGTIKVFNGTFGFIIPTDGGEDIFFHRTKTTCDPKRLAPNSEVEFEVKADEKGRNQAISLTMVQFDKEEKELASFSPADEQKDLPEEKPVSPQRPLKGVVKLFANGKGFIESDEDGTEFGVHFSDIIGNGFRTLHKGERVIFDPEFKDRFRFALNVRLAPDPMSRGTICEFNEIEGHISPDDGSPKIYFRAQDINDSRYWEYDVGDKVKFRALEQRGKQVAVRVSWIDRRHPFERFANLAKADSLIPKLARTASPENWNYRNKPDSYPYPILVNYLYYTFKRLEEQKRVLHGVHPRSHKPFACFHTGLATERQDEIYAFFTESSNWEEGKEGLSRWYLDGFYTGVESPILEIPNLPPIATYFEGDGIKKLIYDHTVELRVNREHILKERKDRFMEIDTLPPYIRQDDDALRTKFDHAVELAKRRVRRNYKTAIPVFSRGEINLLLPLCMARNEVADLALLVQNRGNLYVGWTVLPLDIAYKNARLLARPDTEWLLP